jgi:acyl-CoA dehydrogenase
VNMGLADLVGRPPKALLACNPAQRERYLAPVMRAERTCAFALTEPGAGSDAAAMQTRAVRDEGRGGWCLSGTKHFISHGNSADFLIVIARTGNGADPQPTAFLVEQGTPGFTVGRVHRKMGWRGYPVAELVFEDMFVPDVNVLGKTGDGLRLALRNIAEARMGVAAHCVGMAQRALDYVVPYLQQRRQFGRPLAAYQGLQWMVADMSVQIEQSRALLYTVARSLDAAGGAGPAARAAVSMAKLSATEMAGRVADSALQLMGGAGYMAEGPIEMIYRDVRAFRIGEGTSEIQRNQIARDVLGREMVGA